MRKRNRNGKKAKATTTRKQKRALAKLYRNSDSLHWFRRVAKSMKESLHPAVVRAINGLF